MDLPASAFLLVLPFSSAAAATAHESAFGPSALLGGELVLRESVSADLGDISGTVVSLVRVLIESELHSLVVFEIGGDVRRMLDVLTGEVDLGLGGFEGFTVEGEISRRGNESESLAGIEELDLTLESLSAVGVRAIVGDRDSYSSRTSDLRSELLLGLALGV